jgi:hypothetical protein
MAPLDAGSFRLAAARGDVGALRRIAASCARFDPEAPLGGFTALHAAAVEGRAGAALWLLRRGASIAAVKDDGW